MQQSESFSDLSCTDQIQLAVRELSAFIAAVSELFGVEEARVSAEDWLDESELMEVPRRSTHRDWRTVTIAASVRLSNRLNVALHRQTSPGIPTTDTQLSPMSMSSLRCEEDSLSDFLK